MFQEFNSLKEEFYEKFNDEEFNGFNRATESNEEIQQLKVSYHRVSARVVRFF